MNLSVKNNQDLRETILDAAERCFRRNGVNKTNIGHVAEEAGVSRMTVYRYFADKGELFAGTSLRILSQRWAALIDRVDAQLPLADWIVETLIENWKQMQEENLAHEYRGLGAYENAIEVLLTEPGLATISDNFRPRFEKALEQGELAADTDLDALLGEVAEWVHWICAPLLVSRSVRITTEDQWRRWLKRQLSGGLLS